MGMNSYLQAIGPFDASIEECLEYPKTLYCDTLPGSIVFAEFFHCQTSSLSRDLAAVLEVEPWNFSTHKIPGDRISDPGRFSELSRLETECDAGCELKQLLQLVNTPGWQFYFRPNG